MDNPNSPAYQDSQAEETIIRKIRLKTQALRLIRAERRILQHQLNLYKLKIDLERRIGEDFDPALSQRLDAVQYLIEALTLKNLIGRDK